MRLDNFEKEIESKIVSRGHDYFLEGRVCEIKKIGKEIWQAEVEGSDYENYEIEIKVKDNNIDYWECSCPYYHGPVCKHVVATLYEINEQSDFSEYKDVAFEEKHKNAQVITLFKEMTKDQLIDFMQKSLDNDYNLRDEFLFNSL